MVVMAESDSALIFMSDASSTPNSRNGAVSLDVTMTSDSDSECMPTLVAARSYRSVAETKRRNKRKNFQPRNIAHSEMELGTAGEPYAKRERRSSSDSSESDYALDLSNADFIKSMEAAGKGTPPSSTSKRHHHNQRFDELDAGGGGGAAEGEDEDEVDDDDDDDDEDDDDGGDGGGGGGGGGGVVGGGGDGDDDVRLESSPMDLTCSKNASPYAFGRVNSYYSDSDSDDAKLQHHRRSRHQQQDASVTVAAAAAATTNESLRQNLPEHQQLQLHLRTSFVADGSGGSMSSQGHQQDHLQQHQHQQQQQQQRQQQIQQQQHQQQRRKILNAFKPASSASSYLSHPFVGQSGDASDLKEYAVNTFKELLEIYGLNSDATDVAQTITNNVPISNFSSGKILESLSTSIGDRGSATLLFRNRKSPKSEPPTPPRSPNSLVSFRTTSTPNSTITSSKSKSDVSFSKQMANRSQTSIFSTAGTGLSQNMASILAMATMKEKLNSNNVTGAEIKPNVTITPSRLSPSLSSENGNSVNSGSVTIRRVSPTSPPVSLKENRPQQIHQSLQQTASNHPIDYSRYVKRYSTAIECGNSYCKDLNYREHFHCLDCNSRVFVKKEEMIRHFKWHKKRDESLQHGFMRYSPSDDCSDRFQNCSHNRKQTHYHCIQGTCDKVYISTSDVQMHANYHRKDSAIIQEGFQRLRATEECRTSYCAFFGQRTTHFHCRREHCQFTFKNKADMEKHKTFHIKDEQLTRDGFKKFLKLDPCGYAGCKFSKVCNHIHCVRDGCSYVLHSTGQLSSHKRKHERKDTEMAYRNFKLTQQNVAGFNGADQLSQFADRLLSPTSSLHLFQQSTLNAGVNTTYSSLHDNSYSNSSSEGPVSPANSIKFRSNSGLPLAGGYFTENFSSMDFSHLEDSSESWHRLISQYSASELCPLGIKCPIHSSDHYHCKEPNCDSSFKTRETAESHARMHEAQERLVESLYQEGTPYCIEESCPSEKHYHCTWDGCYETILPHEKLDHLRTHEFSMSQFNSLDALFRRKRGRPPKNRIIEVWNDYSGVSGNDSPQAIFTSFKLPKPSGNVFANSSQQSDCEAGSPSPSRAHSPKHISQQILDQYKFEEYVDVCPDPLCTFSTSSSSPLHYHCRRPRCFFATNTEEQLQLHSTEFHDRVEILDGFLYFDSSVDCRLDNCHNNKVNRHFHCVRPGCGCSFVGYNVMIEHNNKHQLAENALKNNTVIENETEIKCERSSPTQSTSATTNIVATSSTASPDTSNSKSTNVVKASGTFYPLCGLNNARSSSPSSHPEEKLRGDSAATQCEATLAVGLPASTSSSTASTATAASAAPLSTTASSTSPIPALLPSALSISISGAVASVTAPSSASTTLSSIIVGAPSALVSSPVSALLPDWLLADAHTRFSTKDPCCRAFCKLKRKDHYHCNACNQAFSEIEKLKQHTLKHNTNSISPFVNKPENNNNNNHNNNNNNNNNNNSDDNEDVRHSPVVPTTSLPMGIENPYHSADFMAAAQQFALMTSQGISFLPHAMPALYTSQSGLMFTTPHAFPHPHSLINNGLLEAIPTHAANEAATELSSVRSSPPQHEMSQEMKKARIQTSMRILKDEPVPEGYVRYRFNEDCHHDNCGYREHQTHFHCVRLDCCYSFCDKTRFVQHTARHERLDTLMGNEFRQYRSNIPCGQPDCVYAATLASSQNKASHFHCLKCRFVCTDTNKVVAHRRQHAKSDSIMAAGFEKFTPSQACRQPDTCVHSGKQTHYHCLRCQYAVLGLSQMTAHKYRHMD